MSDLQSSALDDWEIKPLDKVGRGVRGVSYDPGNDLLSEDTEDSIRLLRANNVSPGALNFENLQRVRGAIVRSDQVLKEGDIVICGANGSKRLVGKAALFSSQLDFDYTFGAFMNCFRTDPSQASPAFISQLFQSDLYRRYVDFALSGSSINNLSSRQILGFTFPIPQLSEQRVIARVLGDADRLIDCLERLITKKRNVALGTAQALMSGTLRLPGHQGDWMERSLGDLGRFRGGSGFPNRYQGDIEGSIPFYKVSDMNLPGNEIYMSDANNTITPEIASEMGAVVHPERAIIMAKVGAAIFLDRKRILSVPSCIDNNMVAFVVPDGTADVRFTHYLFQQIRFGDIAASSALPALNGRILSAVTVQLPHLKEQIAIAEVLTDMDAEIEALERRLAKTHDLKQAMAQELLSGRTRLV